MVGKTWLQEHEMARHVVSVVQKQPEGNASAQLAFSVSVLLSPGPNPQHGAIYIQREPFLSS